MSDKNDHADISLPDCKANLHAHHIGGIGDTSVTFTPGTTILTGKNATNRTSLLSAVNGVLGGTKASLKTDADSGSVDLTLAPESSQSGSESVTFTREYTRSGGTVTTSGSPYTEDDAIVDTFVTLIETNDARRAVQQQSDLRDVLMRPIDTKEIRRNIRERTRDRDAKQTRLSELDQKIEQEIRLEERRESLREDLERVTEEIDEQETIVAKAEADVEMAEEAEQLVDKLETEREHVRDIENELEVLRAERDSLSEEKEDIKAEYETVTESVPGDPSSAQASPLTVSELEDEIDALQSQAADVDNTINMLMQIVRFNEEKLETANELTEHLNDSNSGSPTDIAAALNPAAEDITCWTCGSTVSQANIEEQTEKLRHIISEKRQQKKQLEDDLLDVRESLDARIETRHERERLETRLEKTKDREQVVSENISTLESDLEDAQDVVDELQQQVTETEELRESQLLGVYDEINDLEYERGRIENELEDIESSLDDIEDAKAERGQLETEIESLNSELEELRGRVETLERTVVDEFNGHMESILDRLGYENIARVWIERRVPDTNTTGVTAGEFELHVVRESDSTGAVYDDDVENLSESERDVIGLIVALAGYLAHDVHETVPFVLLDSVESVDANRLVELTEYFAEYAIFTVIALLPEDAAVFPDRHDRVTADMLTA